MLETRSISHTTATMNLQLFASCFGSDVEKTTVTHPYQRNSGSSDQGSLPAAVLCGVIAEDYKYKERSSLTNLL